MSHLKIFDRIDAQFTPAHVDILGSLNRPPFWWIVYKLSTIALFLSFIVQYSIIHGRIPKPGGLFCFAGSLQIGEILFTQGSFAVLDDVKNRSSSGLSYLRNSGPAIRINDFNGLHRILSPYFIYQHIQSLCYRMIQS